MTIDSNLILQGLQGITAQNRPVSNLLSGVQVGQGLQTNALNQQLLGQKIAQQEALAPIERQLAEQRLTAGQLGIEQKQAILDQLGVPDEPTAKQVAFNTAKLSALPTAEAKLEGIAEMKRQAIAAGRTTANLDELEQVYAISPQKGDELLGATVNAFQQTGFLTAQDEQRVKQESLDIRRQELALKQQIEQRQQVKLSGPLESALLKSQDEVVRAQRDSSEFDILAQQVEDGELTGGIAATTSETFKQLLGTQDDVTELRRKFNKVRLSEGLKNLPPGPATDKDIEQAFKGVPPENAPASQVASFLRGAAKMARFDAGYNQFKSDFISEKSTAKGLNKEWRKTVTSTILERDVTIAEIYAEAAASGLTPEEVKAELGIQ